MHDGQRQSSRTSVPLLVSKFWHESGWLRIQSSHGVDSTGLPNHSFATLFSIRRYVRVAAGENRRTKGCEGQNRRGQARRPVPLRTGE